mmetsp:Transcript_24789/g.43669  ORF Transcript_24789/g.43669 Transcript_24789/m.43669 type:complete len:471 (+) Transcript_24789:89-1501(+)
MKSLNLNIDQLKAILQVPPLKRSSSLISQLVAFTRDIEFFRKLTQENSSQEHVGCCTYMHYEHFWSDELIFSAGDEGNKFYIIMQGSVSVFTQPPKPGAALELVNVLTEGQSFGELALLRGEARMATIVAKEETHFAVLGKNDFKRIIGEIAERRINESVSFLQKLPLFCGWTRTSLLKLSYFFKLRTFSRKQVVYREGDETDYVYFIKEGEFQLLKKVVQEKSKPFKKIKSVTAECAILGKGEILGDEDCMMNQPRSFTCLCFSSTAETYFISKQDFLIRITEDFYKYLQERNTLKSTWRSKKDLAVLSTPVSPPPEFAHKKQSPKRKQNTSLRSNRRLLEVTMTPKELSPVRTILSSKSEELFKSSSNILSRRTLPEVMIHRLKKGVPQKEKKKKEKFVNIHVRQMRSNDSLLPTRLQSPMESPKSTKANLSSETDFVLKSFHTSSTVGLRSNYRSRRTSVISKFKLD